MNIFNSVANFVIGVVVSGLALVGIHTPLTPPTLALSALPAVIQAGESATIEWRATGADECISGYFDTGKALSGSASVSPSKTTTYSITCAKTREVSADSTGVWKLQYTDYTDLWCTSGQPSFKNFYTENECPVDFAPGGNCSGSNTCAVNRWQTKGGTVGDVGEQQYCNLISDVYRCETGNAAFTGLGTSVQSTKTVFSGSLDTLFTQHFDPVLKELRNNGVPNATFEPKQSGFIDGFYPSQEVANRICEVVFPGSKNGEFSTKGYKSPKDNTLLILNGAVWSQDRASRYPGKGKHISRGPGFTCVASVAEPPPPTPRTESVTKSITVIVLEPNDGNPNGDDPPGGGPGGGGGGGQCSDGIDNDGNGQIDYPLDAGCLSVGDSIEAPQCSDGIDNDKDGATDYPEDFNCSSSQDNNETAIPNPPAVISLTVEKNLVQPDHPATLFWSILNVKAGSCTVTGTNGDSFGVSSESGSIASSNLSSETTFTLSCINLDGASVVRSVTVKIAPSFKEI